MSDERFCERCGVSLDLHYGEDDCEAAETRCALIERFDRFNASLLGAR